MGLAVQRFITGIVLLAVVGIVGVQIWARTAPTPEDLGPVDGQLRACPADSQNCVSSTAEDPDQSVPPLECPGLVDQELWALVKDVIAEQPRLTIANEAGRWVHAVGTTPFFGFQDDVELLMRANLRIIDVRSQSRLGGDDLGVNRERVLDLVAAVEAACLA